METLRISLSELSEFRDCRRRWWLHHYRGLSKPESPTGSLALGTNVHDALEQYYRPGGTKEAALLKLRYVYSEARTQLFYEADLKKLDTEFRMATNMVEGYFDWVEEEGVDVDLEIIEAEAEISHPIEVGGTTVILMGKRDAIGFKRSTGTRVLIDHKTCQSLTNHDLDLNEQSQMYLLLQRLNGSSSVQICLWNLLRKTMRTARATPPFYAREELYVSEQQLRHFYERITGVVHDIIETRRRLDDGGSHRGICYPRPSSSCGWKCDFRVACPMVDADPYAEEFIESEFTVTDPYKRYTNV